MVCPRKYNFILPEFQHIETRRIHSCNVECSKLIFKYFCYFSSKLITTQQNKHLTQFRLTRLRCFDVMSP